EVLTHLDVGVFPYAAFIFANNHEHRRKYPTHGQIGPPQIGILMRIAAQVVDHRKLRLDVATLDGGAIDRIAEDCFEELPLNRHQPTVVAEEHVAVAAGCIALSQHEGRGVD